MSWYMPSESARHKRCWMVFPVEGKTLGATVLEREEGYAAWTDTANRVAEFEPLVMVVDPSEVARARHMLSSGIELLEAPVDEFWARDVGPTFVLNTHSETPSLGAVDWVFNGWGDHEWGEWMKSAMLAPLMAEYAGAELVESELVNEGGGFHVDGEGTVLLTETVQLDERRNPSATRESVEAEMLRTLGASNAIWLPRGLSRDYEEFGTNGHVDIVATFPSPARILLHHQADRSHPDFEVTKELQGFLSEQTDAFGRDLTIIDLPAPTTLRDSVGFVDWSYVNHLVVNDGVIACGFGEERADARARAILSEAYPGRRVVTVDSRPIFARGGGVHCITQHEPALEAFKSDVSRPEAVDV